MRPASETEVTMPTYRLQTNACGRIPRRSFLADLGMGFTGLALGAMLHRDGFANTSGVWTPPNGQPHFAPKVKSVIWLFMIGGTSHVESFDPKPALNKYAGKSIAETPYRDVLDKKYLDENIKHARKHKHVETLFGRRREIPDINSQSPRVRAHLTRT